MTDSKKPTSPSAGPGAGAAPGAPVAPCPIECPGAVAYSPLGKKWGWDDYTSAAVPWMSVQTGQSDTVTAKAKDPAHAGRMCNVTYESSDPAIATVSPATGSGDNETLTITGVRKGEVTITAKCKGGTVGTFKVAVKDLLRKTLMVRLINHPAYASTDVAAAGIQTYMNNMYKQAVTEFTVTKVAAQTVAFDTDGSNDIDVGGGWPSGDVTRIVTAAGDRSYDFNVFLVDKPNDGSLGWSGFSNAEQAAVIHPDVSGEDENTIAHETGHGLFGLRHSAGADTDNLMHATAAGTTMLRKSQWDQINP